jgi:hypothetical protein
MSENRTFTAYGALAANRRVKVRAGTTTTPPQVEYAGAGEQHIGTTTMACADGALIAIKLRNNPGPWRAVAAEALAVGATLYGAASGKIQDTAAGSALGIAITAADADGDDIDFVDIAVSSTTAAGTSIADAGGFTAAATVEAALAELYQHVLSAQAFIPVALTSLRELTAGAIPNAAANGGLLASDTTPILNTANGDTDGAFRLSWAASNSDAVGFQIPLPPDFDGAANLEIHVRAAMAGATDTPTISCDSYFDEGDIKVADVSAAITGAAYAEYTITIAAADIPDTAQTFSVELTPGAHTTDALYLSAIWIEYKRKLLTA